jgi:hypothetical protein
MGLKASAKEQPSTEVAEIVNSPVLDGVAES